MIFANNFGFTYESCRRLRELPSVGFMGESGASGIFRCAAREVVRDAEALFFHLRNRLSLNEGARILIFSAGVSDTVTTALASSMLGARLTLSDKQPSVEMDFELVIGPRHCGNGAFISFDELSALIQGELASPNKTLPQFSEGYAEFTFVYDNRGRWFSESYGEEVLISIGAEYISASSLIHRQVHISSFQPCSREGFIFGMIAPMMMGCDYYYSSPSPTFFERMRTVSPHHLLCQPSLTSGLVDIIKSSKRASLRGHLTYLQYKKLCGYTDSQNRGAFKRYSAVYRNQQLGGRLRSLTTVGDLPQIHTRTLLDFRVYPTVILSFCGCPIAGYRRANDESGVWRLPREMEADMCRVSPGGVGSLTFFGPLVTSDKCSSLNTNMPQNTVLVSDLYGFILKNRRFFVKGRVNF